MVRYSGVDSSNPELDEPPKTIRQLEPIPKSLSIWRLARSSLTLLSTLLFGITAWFAASTFADNPRSQANHIFQSWLQISFGSTVIILRVLQGLTSTMTALAVSQAQEGIQWMLVNRHEGLRLLSFLGLSPSTGAWGFIQLCFGRRLQFGDRAFAVLRLFLLGVLFVASIALFIGTSTVTAYYSVRSIDVAAGTGPFNGSMVEPLVESFSKQVPFAALVSTYNFVKNSQFSVVSEPLSCPENTRRCDSYLLPGGTYLMYPPCSEDVTVVIHDAPGTQVEFSEGLISGDSFLEEDCVVYGSNDNIVGVYFCLAKSRAREGSLIAAIFQCPNGTQGGDCHTGQSGSSSVHNISTTMTVYNRKMTAVCSARNNSISSVYDLGDPEMLRDINTTALKVGASWLLNYTASGLPAMSSAAFWFWYTPTDTYDSTWTVDSYTSLQSLLAFLLWLGCPTNNMPNVTFDQQLESLPPEFHTTASISEPYTRFVLNETAFTVYIVFQSTALAFCWAIVIWQIVSVCSGRPLLATSSFPQVDFASKLRQVSQTDDALTSPVGQIPTGESSDSKIRYSLATVVVAVARHDPDEAVRTADTPEHPVLSQEATPRTSSSPTSRPRICELDLPSDIEMTHITHPFELAQAGNDVLERSSLNDASLNPYPADLGYHDVQERLDSHDRVASPGSSEVTAVVRSVDGAR